MTEALRAAVVRVLKDMREYGPDDLVYEVRHRLSRSGGGEATESDIVDLVVSDDPNEPARLTFHIQLARWEDADLETWTATTDGLPTTPGTEARRTRIMERLGLGEASIARITDAFPRHESGTIVIHDPQDWDPWFTSERMQGRGFYWDAYRRVLEENLDAYAVDAIDVATSAVVRRLADPTRPARYQAKGLVVGHVQSGKTANFTGVIAKAVDAGYRLVIVLTGTIEILRSQTQRRIDMELVGRENILGGIDPTDPGLVKDVDYAGTGDRDWVEGRFLVHGSRPRDLGHPDVVRLTSSRWDYARLAAGLSALDFRSGNQLKDPRRPLYDEANLYGTDVRIAVVKKNKAVLTKLVDDLKRIHTDLGEIPTLIVDDEADQASVNTVRKLSSADKRERSAINQKLSELLRVLGRAQYVGYTATPFANVFVDPDDSEDIFPKDFIVSLEPPATYMGGRDFHDLEPLPEGVPATVANSNERAWVRDIVSDADDEDARSAELRTALDSFVLSGAIKRWRADASGKPDRFRHHTMLIHESVSQAEHKALAHVVHDVWRRAGYSTPAGMRRLHELWRDDFLPVSRARAGDETLPEDFADLRRFIGPVVDAIQAGGRPIITVNGDKDSDYTQAGLDFQAGGVWKILIGGAKLSRGFTVEGLTTTWYTRRTYAADSLMQMGRWFGYRAGYRDLVRLFIGRNVPGPRKTVVDLYEAFGAIIRDEEEFRAELRAFQGADELGHPLVTPIQVPPLVFQSRPDIKPTGTNKMYNAVLAFKGEGGRVKDFFQQPPRRAKANPTHFAAVGPLLDAATMTGTFFDYDGNTYVARYGVVPSDVVKAALEKFRWRSGYEFAPTLQFLDQAVAEGTLTEFVVMVPELGTSVERIVGDRQGIRVLRRNRRTDRDDEFSGSSPRQRCAMEIISGGITSDAHSRYRGTKQSFTAAALAHPDAFDLHTATRGALLLTFAADPAGGDSDPKALPRAADPEDVATLFSLAFPRASAPHGRVGFTVRVKGAGAIVDVGQASG